MISTRPRSNAARFRLLVVALLHFVATAALPFTHAHAPVQSAADVVAELTDAEPGSQRIHADLCVACRTLMNAQAGPVLPEVGAAPSEGVAPVHARDETAADPHFTPSRPRAPPVA